MDPRLAWEAERISELRDGVARSITIFVSGVSGVGKTSLAHTLSHLLGIRQRVSLGVITKTLQYLTHDERFLVFDRGKLDPLNIEPLLETSQLICSIVNLIVERAERDGTDYIIDGVQLHPAFLDLPPQRLYLFLQSPPALEYLTRLRASTTHPRRDRDATLAQVACLKDLESRMFAAFPKQSNVIVLPAINGEQEIALVALEAIHGWLDQCKQTNVSRMPARLT